VRLQIKMLDKGELGSGDSLVMAFDEHDQGGRFHGR
jgi:hypothetical protein